MTRRLLGLALWMIVALGCHAGTLLEVPEEAPPANQLWEEGQEAMREGQPQQAIARYERSLDSDPALTRNHLSLAAAYLEKGDPEAARPHLEKYVATHPENLPARGYLAELLLRLDQLPEARGEYERLAAALQEKGPAEDNQLIRCHRRLMEIAEALEDSYGQHLHRGIGLFLLAKARAVLPEPDGLLPTEGLLCKAAGELSLARLERPDEARPCWYLYEVWSQLPLRQPALRSLDSARLAAPFTYLTPAEQRGLQLACQCLQMERMPM
jgi:tetratricopeptide (TPR) repeat protein